MQAPVYRVLSLVCAVVVGVPIGTNLGLLHLCWMLLSGGLLGSRGALFPGLSALGLSDAVRTIGPGAPWGRGGGRVVGWCRPGRRCFGRRAGGSRTSTVGITRSQST